MSMVEGSVPPYQGVPLSELLNDSAKKKKRGYVPLVTTLRLYAGWLLGWYLLLYAVGGYAATRSLPFSIPFVVELLPSPIVATIAFAVFAFLLLTSLHRALKLKAGAGVLFSLILIALVGLFWVNVQ
jgi:hypothetical protein